MTNNLAYYFAITQARFFVPFCLGQVRSISRPANSFTFLSLTRWHGK